MKMQLTAILLLLSISMFSQSKILIYKTDGTIDSLSLLHIKNVSFSTTTGKISNQNLVAYWPFDGNAIDSSGNENNAILCNATRIQDRFGADSSAFSFDGQSNAIEFGNILDTVFSATPVAKFSISGWALIKSNTSYWSCVICKCGGGSTGPYQWIISYLNGYLFANVSSDTADKNSIILQSPASLNQWFHFALVFDGSLTESQRVKLYVNGSSGSTYVYQNTGTLGTNTKDSQADLTIGAVHQPNSSDWSDFLNGNVDDIRIYNRALSATEVLNLYLAPN